jgi:hypothetical protein
VQHPFEMVRPLLALVFGGIAGVQDASNRVERRLVDERLVGAGVLDPAKRHHPEVEPVVQDDVHPLWVQGPVRLVLGGSDPQTQVVGLIRETANGVEAGGVTPKAPGDDGSGHRGVGPR